MLKRKRGSNLLRFNSVPPHILWITIAASWLGMIGTIILGYPLWVIGVVVFLPWIPILCSEAFWKYRHYAWFALFEILLVLQSLHMIEHFAQVIEVDVIGWPRALSTGIIGTLNVEYVHFTFDTFLLIATTILLFGKFRRNIPLWIAFVVAIWHTAEHWYITYFYTFDYANYDPNNPTGLHAEVGMLGQGGLLWPNSPFPRIELHFLYNLLYTLPLLWAFVLVVREAYDEHLRRVFPSLTKSQLITLDRNLESLQVEPGDIIIRQGMPADRFYIISKGEVEVIQEMNGQTMVISVLSKGQFFGNVGLLTGAPHLASVRARTYCDLLALDREAFCSAVGTASPAAQASPSALSQPDATKVPIPISEGAAAPPVGSAWSGQIPSPAQAPLPPPATPPLAEIIGR